MEQEAKSLKLGDKEVSERTPFFIAEIGSNHDGDFDKAVKHIIAAAEAGADAVKFQMFDADDIVPADHPERSKVERYVLPSGWVKPLKMIAEENNLVFFASAFNIKALETLESADVLIHKVASSEVLNPKLLLAAGRTLKPVLISFGMTEWYEIEIAIKILKESKNTQIIPMHCSAKYPLRVEDANLKFISKLRDRFGQIVGFSDHTESVDIGAWAAVLGARVFEKHMTLNRSDEGADHFYALEPKQLKFYCDNVRKSIKSLGDGEKSYLPEEKSGRRRLGIKITNNALKGQKLGDLIISELRPRTDIPANLLGFLKGLELRRDLPSESNFTWDDIE